MLVKHANFNKHAFWGLVGSALGGAAKFGLKGVGKLIGYGIKNPTKALTTAGAGMGAWDAAGKAIDNFEEIAATPYRYF